MSSSDLSVVPPTTAAERRVLDVIRALPEFDSVRVSEDEYGDTSLVFDVARAGGFDYDEEKRIDRLFEELARYIEALKEGADVGQ